MSLYHTYRPKDFSEVMGNVETVQALKAAVEKDDPPHAYLFVGPYGCGKTSLARLTANKLGCTGDDYREVDSASFRGIDTIRDIRRQASFMGMNGGRRAWLLDECHQITGMAAEAMLKMLEDPPEHSFFMLATTEPQKLLETVKSRCALFQVSLLNDIQMKRLLRQVVQAEKQTLEKDIYDRIVIDAQGHARNALQILEQVLDAPEEDRLKIAQRSAEQQSKTIELCRALTDRSGWTKVRQILAGLKDENPESIRQSVLGYCTATLLKKEDDGIAGVMEAFEQPRYDMGFSGIVYASYCVVKGGLGVE